VHLPLLTVDYELPLDTLNQPTGRAAQLAVGNVTGTDQHRVARMRAWTSVDGGATWQAAPVERDRGRRNDLTLPSVARGTAVSLRVDAVDQAGGIRQTLFDAYTA
jgi:hypothetical protein